MAGTGISSAGNVIYAVTLVAYVALLGRLILHYRDSRRVGDGRLDPNIYLVLCAVVGAGSIALTMRWGLPNAPFAFLFSIGAALGLADPVIAMAFLVANVVLRPWEIVLVPEMAVIPRILGGVCLLAWVFHGFRKRTFHLLWNAPVALFGALAFWILLSASMSGDPESGLRSYAETFGIAAVLFVLVANIVDRPRDVRLVRDLIAVLIVVAVIVAWIGTNAAAPDSRLEGRGLMGNPNDLAAMIVVALPWIAIPKLAMRTERVSGLGKLVAGAASVVLLAGLWLSQSRGALMALVAGGLAHFVARTRRPRTALLLCICAIPIAAAGISWIDLNRQAEDVSSSTQSRLSFVLAGIRMAAEKPLLGVGFDRFPKVFEIYAPAFAYERGQRTAHSTWVLALAEDGLPALILLVCLFVGVVRRSWRLRDAWPELFPAVVAYGIAMSFLSHTYLSFPYLVFALVLAAAKIRRREEHA